MSLDGYYRGTDTKVNTNDKVGRRHAKEDLKVLFEWNLRSNSTKYKIDLLHEGRKGGVDVEEGKWYGLYRDQNPQNFNQFTLPFPTANFQIRKEKYFNLDYQWVSSKGKIQKSHDPNYKLNSLIRYNRDLKEFFFVDYETYLKKMDTVGCWSPKTVYSVDRYGNQVPEYWMCWELKDVPFYVENESGIWVRDTTFDDIVIYQEFVDDYREKRKIFQELQKIE